MKMTKEAKLLPTDVRRLYDQMEKLFQEIPFVAKEGKIIYEEYVWRMIK